MSVHDELPCEKVKILPAEVKFLPLVFFPMLMV